MNKKRGLTILEIVLVVVFLTAISAILIYQKTELDAMHRDDIRKSAINAIYYALEENFYSNYGYYPEYIDSDILTAINPNNFIDPSGYPLGNPESSYSYQATNCYLSHCKEYTLSATLEKEATFAKYNRN